MSRGSKKKKRRSRGALYWTPRVLGVLFCAFISIFALDVLGEYSGLDLAVALFMHLVPTYIAIGVLLVAWRWPLPGGVAYVVLGLAYIIGTWNRWMQGDDYSFLAAYAMISGPLFLTGILFLLGNSTQLKKHI